MKATEARAAVESRYNEAYMADERRGRIESMSDWKQRTVNFDHLYAGRYYAVYPNEVQAKKVDPSLKVTNFIKTATDDIARLVAESQPTLRVDPEGKANSRVEAASLKEAVGRTYWKFNKAERGTKQLAMDLIRAGLAFEVSLPVKNKPYPVHFRVDPLFAYPTFFGGELVDLLVCQKLKLRAAAAMFPDLGLEFDPKANDDVEIVDYYSMDAVSKWVFTLDKGGSPQRGVIARGFMHDFGKPLVAYTNSPTADGQWSGIFDQQGSVINILNRTLTMIVDDTERAVYSPRVFSNIANIDEYGPDAKLLPDDPSQPATVTNVATAQVSPHLFNVMGMLETAVRQGAHYPASRSGEVPQSIASAAFVASTQGPLTSVVNEKQQEIASLRETQLELDYAIDRKFLDEKKDLLVPVGDKRSYTPSRDIGENYTCRVLYGLGSGLDKLNQGVYVQQANGNGLISSETARELMHDIIDPLAEQQKVEKEAVRAGVMQSVQNDLPWSLRLRLAALMAEGDDILAAAAKIQAELDAQQAQQQGQPGPVPEGVSAGEQALAVQKGAQEVPQLAGQPALPPALGIPPPRVPGPGPSQNVTINR